MKNCLSLKHFALLFLGVSISNLFSQKSLQEITSYSNSSSGHQITWEMDLNGKKLVSVLDTNRRKVLLYQLNNKTLSLFDEVTISGSSEISVPNHGGDLNNDGYDDLVIGLPKDLGEVHIYWGSVSGFSSSPSQIISGTVSDAQFGFRILSSTDVNGDNIDDLFVSEPNYRPKNYNAGRIHVFYGSKTGFISTTPNEILSNTQEDSKFGYWLSDAGDVNNDGYNDLITSSKFKYPDRWNVSRSVDIFFGGPTGMTNSRKQEISFYSKDENKGVNAMGCGDINGDGFDDILYYNSYNFVIHYGNSIGVNTESERASITGLTLQRSIDPLKVMPLGDINNDGFDDIGFTTTEVTASPYRSSRTILTVYTGSSDGLNEAPNFEFKNEDNSLIFSNISKASDWNQDGHPELLVSYLSSTTNESSVKLLAGTFDLHANLLVEDDRMCFPGNEFTFLNQSNFADSVILKVEGIDSNITGLDTINYHFLTAGEKWVVVEAYDRLLNHLHIDSVWVYPQSFLPDGQYSVGETGDFESLLALQQGLECGINGEINVSFISPEFDEHLVLDSVYHFSPDSRIHLISDDYTQIAGLTINKSNNVKIEKIKFVDLVLNTNPGIRYEDAVSVSHSKGIEFDHCLFQGTESVLEQTHFNHCSLVKMTNNKFERKYKYSINGIDILERMYPIKCDSCDHVLIQNNEFIIDANDRAITFTGHHLQIKKNLIEGKKDSDPYKTATADYAMNIVSQGIEILSNSVKNVENGILIKNSNGIDSLNLIANNSVSDNIGSYSTGKHCMTLIGCNDLHLYHNTLVHGILPENTIKPSSVSDRRGNALFINGSNNIRVLNNLLATNDIYHTSSIAFSASNSTLFSDFNFFQGKVSYPPYYNSNLNNTQRHSKPEDLDNNSFFVDSILFDRSVENPVNHLDKILNHAPVLEYVKRDIKDSLRGKVLTDLGAYIIDPDTVSTYLVNVGIESFLTQQISLGENDLQIKIVNTRSLPVHRLTINYSVNGKHETSELWIGSLASGDTLAYNFSKRLQIPRERLYTIKAWVEIPEAYMDTHQDNDTLVQEFGIEMNGDYTIMCDTCFFPTLEEANDNLTKCGVFSHVNFLIPDGDYSTNDFFYCAEGPVTYSSLSGDPESVIIKMHTLKVDHVELANMTIVPHVSQWVQTGFPRKGLTLNALTNTTFNNCTFEIKDTTNLTTETGNGLSLIRCSGVVIKDCTFKNTGTSIAFTNFTNFGSSSFNDVCEIVNCNFYGSTTAIALGGDHYSSPINIHNCKTYNCDHAVEIYEGFISKLNIYNNEFLTNEECYKGSISVDVRDLKIYNNNLVSLNNYPINIRRVTRNDVVNIYNNKIENRSSTGYSFRNAMYFYGFRYYEMEGQVNIIHNTCRGGFRVRNETLKINSFNNIFYSDSMQLMSYPANIQLTSSNNNFYRKDNGPLLTIGIDDFSDLATLQTKYPLTEQNSINVDPEFLDTIFKATSLSLIGKGSTIEAYPFLFNDIDSKERKKMFPDLGAHQISDELVTGFEELSKQDYNVGIYPVPFQETFILEGLDPEESGFITWYDLSGKVVLKQHFNRERTLSATDITSGIYTLIITTDSDFQKVIKVIKE